VRRQGCRLTILRCGGGEGGYEGDEHREQMRTTTGGIVIPVTDLDAHFTHAKVEGATITSAKS
jgi:hypothetical protein